MKEKFNSRIGFLLVSAGCAIGIGNVWKFPYITGQNGGGFFVAVYIACLLLLGVPVLAMELAIGRASGKSIIPGYRMLEKEGSKWHIHGWFCIAGSYLLMMYYTTVAGWMLSYFFKFLTGKFDNAGVETADVFTSMLGNPGEMGFFMVLVVVAGFAVCSIGLQNGLEKITKVMMAGLLLLILVLVVKSVTLPKAMGGLKFYLLPDVNKAREIGIANVVMAAMSQAFFTLSIGIACMEIFGASMSKNKTLCNESILICALDTFVAFCSGLIVFPACSNFGIEPDAGPSLIFITLPQVFMNMTGGRIWGTLFFLFMTFASFSTVIAVFENLISSLMETRNMDRKKSSLINCVIVTLTSIPCVLGYNVWSSLHILGDRDVLDSEDFLVSNILLPIGAIIFVLFCSWKFGWGLDEFLKEANTGEGVKFSSAMKYYFKIVLPLLILVVFIKGFI